MVAVDWAHQVLPLQEQLEVLCTEEQLPSAPSADLLLTKLSNALLPFGAAVQFESPTNQMGISLNKTLAAAPDAEQIQTKIFEGKKSDNFGKINSKKTLILDLLENTPDTKTASINADLYNQNQSFTTQTQFFTSTKELAVKKQLLKNWAATIRSDIVERTLESKLSSDVRISFKISRTGEILSIETIGKSVTNESIKNFIDVIRMSGKFPMAPQGLKLDYVTFPVNFRSRG